MANGKVRHMFPGGNTSLGFFSFYDQIISQEDAKRIVIIKGGPGTGKSTFMKRVGEAMVKKGLDTEYLHCSSDNNSLDGIKIPELGVVIVDGTLPHAVEPLCPGAVDEILYFGQFWNEEGIKNHKNDIIETGKKLKALFSRAYKYLKAASSIYESSSDIYKSSENEGKVNLNATRLSEEIFKGKNVSDKTGKQRKMFASAITPEGYINYLDNIISDNKVYELRGSTGTCESEILEKVKAWALERNYYIEAYYCALNPYKLEHIVLPSLKIVITTSNKYHNAHLSRHISIDMQKFYNKKAISAYRNDLDANQNEFDRLMSCALQILSNVKALHDKLEAYYIPNVDFKAINSCYNDIMKKISG